MLKISFTLFSFAFKSYYLSLLSFDQIIISVEQRALNL